MEQIDNIFLNLEEAVSLALEEGNPERFLHSIYADFWRNDAFGRGDCVGRFFGYGAGELARRSLGFDARRVLAALRLG